MSTETILLTCAGGRMIPQLASALKRESPTRRLIGVDANTEIGNDFPRDLNSFFPVPVADGTDYSERLLEICITEEVAVVVPGSDEEAVRLAHDRNMFSENGVCVNAFSPDTISIYTDKYQLFQTLAAINIPTPKAILISNSIELRRAALALGYPEKPVVLKPTKGRGRRGVSFLSEKPMAAHPDLPPSFTLQEHEAACTFDKEMLMLAEYVDGTALTVDVLSDNGRILQSVCREWLSHWRFPFPGQLVSPDDKVLSLVREVCACFGLHGLLDMDLIRDESGAPVLIEINPRPSGSIPAALVAGVPLYSQLTDLLLGRDVADVGHPQNILVTQKDTELTTVSPPSH